MCSGDYEIPPSSTRETTFISRDPRFEAAVVVQKATRGYLGRSHCNYLRWFKPRYDARKALQKMAETTEPHHDVEEQPVETVWKASDVLHQLQRLSTISSKCAESPLVVSGT